MWFRNNTGLLATLIIGGIIRAFFLFWFFADLGSDPDAYKQIAVNVRTKGIYGQQFGDSQSFQTSVQSTAFRPPLYPLILSLMVTNASSDDDQQKQPSVSLFGIAVFHWCLGMATLALAYSIGRNHQLSQPCCFFLAMLVACDPIALRTYPAPDQRLPLGEVGIEGKGTDLAIVTYGNGHYLSQQAAHQLAEAGIAARVIDMRWLAPLPEAAVLEATKDCTATLIVDECRRTGSQSEALMTLFSEAGRTRLARVVAADSFIATGPAYAATLPSVEGIMTAALKLVGDAA